MTSPIPLAGAAPRSAIIQAVAYFLGIDGGGSQTTFVLGDEKSVLASVQAGGSNMVRVGESQTRSVLQQGVRQVCQQGGIKPAHVVGLCAGIAGAARDEIRQKIARLLAKWIQGKIEVVGDVVVAHEAALDGGPGVVVISGTGSIAYGRHESGRTARAGGWGYAISDEGSGYWIGVQAVAAVTHALDAGGYTELSDRIPKLWHVDSYDELIAAANASPAPDFAALLPEVLAAADAGDSYARHLVIRAGAELAGLAEVVFRRLWQPGDVVSFGLAGSVFQHVAAVRDSFRREIHRTVPQAPVFLGGKTGGEGALAMARKLVAAQG